MEVCRMLRDRQRANEKGMTINVGNTQGLYLCKLTELYSHTSKQVIMCEPLFCYSHVI
jgi:hypothetical protein